MLDFAVVEPLLEPPVTVEERCMRSAAHDFKLDYFLLRAIREQEAGDPGMKKRNRNGSHDLGEMQINTVTVADFASFGITEKDLRRDTCLNIYAGALHLWRKIAETGDVWKGVAWYHNKRKALGFPYAKQVYRRYVRLLDAFNAKWVVADKDNPAERVRVATEDS